MSLARVVRAVAVAPRVLACVPVRLAHSLSDRENAAEKQYFNQEEEKLLKVRGIGSTLQICAALQNFVGALRSLRSTS